MVFLDPEHEFLQEDGVLPGDDYREIWKRVDGNAHNSFGGRCFCPMRPVPSAFSLFLERMWLFLHDKHQRMLMMMVVL